MAKTAFRVEDGLVPGHVNSDLGHDTARFRHQYMSGNVDVEGNLQVDGAIQVNGVANIPNLSGGGGGGGGISQAQSIAFAIALG